MNGDDPSATSQDPLATGAGAGLLAAVRFLTVLPAGSAAEAQPLAGAMMYFPLVGAGLGGVGAIVLLGADALGLGLPLAALAGLGAVILLSGALHEDGIADFADGLGASNPENRLKVMRDSRSGVFGVLALMFSVGLRVAALAALGSASTAAAALVAAGAVSRAPLPAIVRWSRPARTDGLAAGAGRPTAAGVWIAAGSASGMAAIAIGVVDAVGAVVACAAGAAFVTVLARRRIGGITGDTLGAAQQAGEVAVLLALVAAR